MGRDIAAVAGSFRPDRQRLWASLPPALLVLVTAGVVAPAFHHAIEVWSTTEEFSFGFLVVPICLWLIWLRRRQLQTSRRAPASAGLLVVVAALALYVLAYRVGINAVAGLAIIPLLGGGIVYLFGWQIARHLAFPLGFLAFGLGLYRGLLDSVGFALQALTASGANRLGQAVGIPVERDGLVLQAEGFAFLVAEACSGMSSLLSLLALAAVWVSLIQGSRGGRLAIFASVLPLVVLANTLRVTLVLLIASAFGQSVAVGFFHGLSSLVLFGLALAGLLVMTRICRCQLSRFAV